MGNWRIFKLRQNHAYPSHFKHSSTVNFSNQHHNVKTMSSNTATAKRQVSTTSVLSVKPQCKIHTTAVVADKAQLTGANTISIGENSFIHPHAKVKAEHGNVTIGKGCIISERATVGPAAPAEGNTTEEVDVILGDGVSIESGAVISARQVGDHSTIEINAKVGAGAVVGKWCKVGPLCEVGVDEVVEDFTVVFGDGGGKRRVDAVVRERRDVRDLRVRGREKEVEVLRGLVADGKGKWMG